VPADVRKYEVAYKGRLIGLSFISAHPSHPNALVGTIVPLDRKGEWDKNTLEVNFDSPVHDIVPDTYTDRQLLDQLLALAHIEPEKVTVHPVPLASRMSRPSP
jgi:hypothetical protein